MRTPVEEVFVRRRTTEVALRDGSRVHLRPILPEDRALIVAGFRNLSPESRYRRFMRPIEELEVNRPMRDLLEAIGARMEHDSPGLLRVELDLPARARELRGSPLYEVLRAVARGDGPVFRPELLSPEP